MAVRAAILKLVFETVQLMSRIGIQKLFMGISFEIRILSLNYYWNNGERGKKGGEKKRKKSFSPQGLNPRRLHISQGPYRLAICQFKSSVKCTVCSHLGTNILGTGHLNEVFWAHSFSAHIQLGTNYLGTVSFRHSLFRHRAI